MKKILSEKENKITEKAFSKGFLTSVISILLCIVALCSMTYAWFTEEAASNCNTLVSGSFDLDISVTYHNTATATDATVVVTRDENGVMRCTLEEIGAYTVVLSMTTASSVKGYCCVSVNGREEVTAPISKDPEIGVDSLTFTVTTTAENTTLVFTPKWGYPASPTIINNGVCPT